MNETTVLEFPRQYLPAAVRFDEWSAIEPYYRELSDRGVASLAQFERWLMDWSEVDAAFDEESTAREVAMTCATDDPERERRHLHFVENVRPKREPWRFALRKKLAELADKFRPPPKRYEVLVRGARNAVEIYRDENIPLKVADEKLVLRYQKLTGGLTVRYRDQELTIPQAARFLEEPDRAVREQVWRLVSERYLQDAGEFDSVYLQMAAVRHKIALNAGCRDFRAYMFKALERFDYTPTHCKAFHDAIEKVLVPAAVRLAEDRRRRLKLDSLRPWDTAVDPDGRAPLRPFENIDRLVSGSTRIFSQVNPELGRIFETMQSRGALDLDSRKGKAPGGYQATFQERRAPFIFMNAVGTERDVETLLHEGGHAFHTWACRSDPLLTYRNYPMEFAEVASMGMECLSLPFLGEFYGDDAGRARRRFFREIVNFLPYMATVDAMQHFVYTNIGELEQADGSWRIRDGQERVEMWKDEWQRLTRRFLPFVDRAGLERDERHIWHRKLHFFEAPFYYVEYGIAQLGALQVWKNAGCPGSKPLDRDRYDHAVALYRNGLALGGARPLPELFEAAGLRFDFTEATLRPLIDAVMAEIESP
ncbi:MAG: M3 family oligoendopeptidase [Planctomycetes bacterium]|nr:M3 family oligoendopeptidase [Planctomycetota bacterium]